MENLEIRKVTVNLPAHLLGTAQEATGLGITETIKEGLNNLAHANACQEFLKLRGKFKFSLDLNELRKDRDEN